jgi:hypothetical protein
MTAGSVTAAAGVAGGAVGVVAQAASANKTMVKIRMLLKCFILVPPLKIGEYANVRMANKLYFHHPL